MRRISLFFLLGAILFALLGGWGCFCGNVYTASIGLTGLVGCGLVVVLRQLADMADLERQLETCRAEEAERLENARKIELQISEDARQTTVQFLRELSHALRIPISIVIGYTDLLSGDFNIEKETQKEYIQKMNEQVNYINDILGQMMMEMRNSVDMPTAMLQSVDLLELLRRIEYDMSTVFHSNGIEIRVISSEESVIIEGDVVKLTKVFYNILENSLKYMGRGGIVNITCSRSSENEIMIIFKDDGVGMPQEETAHIFQLNYQGSNKKSGYGLGLHMAKVGVEAHGGTIYARSDTGKGMGIYITLPTSPNPRTSIKYTKLPYPSPLGGEEAEENMDMPEKSGKR